MPTIQPAVYAEKDGNLEVTTTEEKKEVYSMERLLELKAHYEADVAHFTAKVAEVDELITQLQNLST
ncbi:MAG: hypothetical protein GWN93_27025 [Deltaproteobacteria bacterium]|nr:hypothetical protein [Deltaproteobacteria bacterium]